MKKSVKFYCLILTIAFTTSCEKLSQSSEQLTVNSLGQPVHQDIPYEQAYSIKYYLNQEMQTLKLLDLSADRNGNIRVLSDQGVLMPENADIFYSGEFVNDVSYTPLEKKNISALLTADGHTFYLDDQQIFSNAWAGKIQIDHKIPNAYLFAKGKDFNFLVSDGKQISFLNEKGKESWSGSCDNLIQILYVVKTDRFILVSPHEVSELTMNMKVKKIYEGADITAAAVFNGDIVIGTKKGYLFLSDKKLIDSVPWPEITTVEVLHGDLWFGTTWGAFKLTPDGKYNYYAGERWLPGNHILELEEGKEDAVLVLTEKGLGAIQFRRMTLEEKAMFFEKQVRQKNIRYGFNCSVSVLPESYASAQMGAQASDNLWTGMYLASQLFRYKVTGSEEARLNAYEAFEAMERLHTITNIEGLFARSFERDYMVMNTKEKGWEKKELFSGSPAKIWMPGTDHANWTWRSTASSDQAVGQVFALTMILELVEEEDWRNRALKCLDNLMEYIVDNDMYIIDVDGEPTLWGKWNPDYVNSFPTNVGDRRLYSSNIVGFLQTAYKFTGKEKYKEKAYELMDDFGYLENLMRPISEIGRADEDADEWSKQLSHEWNHSDDEMYFLAYFGLFPYAFTPELGEKFKESIRDHWEVERPEKNALWNFIYSITGAKEFDLEESIEFLQEYPLDLRNWAVHNSHRKDIELLPKNFRNQSTRELLPLSEIPLYRHNGEIFKLDIEGNGDRLISAGDVWLLPYWMGRYLGVISSPLK